MTRTLRLAASLLLFAAEASPAPDPAAADMAAAARAFLAALPPALQAEARLAVGDPDRARWGYVPGKRRGVRLKDMSPTARAAAHALLRASSSARGYAKATGVVELEGILREIETFGWFRDPELYWVTIFGTPGDGTLWGWRFEGHHLSLNYSATRGDVLVSTPAFFGANPARVPAGPRAGWRVLAAEEELARRLLATLTPAERRRAVVSESAPADILMRPGRPMPPEPEGLPSSDMSPAAREILRSLLAAYVETARPEIAAARWKRIETAGVGNVRFAWAGSANPGRGHYYRIQGPTFVVEYDNTQNGANHVHSVWHDLGTGAATDLLRRHYEEDPHHAVASADAGPRRKSRRPSAAVLRPPPENFARSRPSPLPRGAGCADCFSPGSSPPRSPVSPKIPSLLRAPLRAPSP